MPSDPQFSVDEHGRPDARREPPAPRKSREFRCSECGSRCTRSDTSDLEYGHGHYCSRRPSSLPGNRGPDR